MVATLLSIFSTFSAKMAAQRERSFIMIKPDGIQRGLVGEIIQRFEKRGYKLVAMKFMQADFELLKKHYGEHVGKPFFEKLVNYIKSGPVVPMASEDHLKKHYADLAGKGFFAGLVKYMSEGPLVPMVWEGADVVKTGRVMLGETDPLKSKPGTIRGDYCIQLGRNICHGSDSVESAEKEIALWFKPEELQKWQSCGEPWLYE